MAVAKTGILLTHSGSYPRIGDSPDLSALRRAIGALDRGQATVADVHEARNEMTCRAISDQVSAGLDVITDGQIRWYDPISHLAGKLEGVDIRGLLRFFDTNFYFRQPVFGSRPVRRGPMVVDEFVFARDAVAGLPTASWNGARPVVKQVLTGPYTLAKFSLSQDASLTALDAQAALEARAVVLAEALTAEIKDLAAAGAEIIQVDEPAILKYPSDWPVFRAALGVLLGAAGEARKPGIALEIVLAVYFHDCVPLYEKLAALPVDVLALDFTYNPALEDAVVSAGAPCSLGLGLIDGRNTKLENPAEVARRVERMLPKIAGGRAFLGASSGLEYLPRDRAKAKLDLLGQVRQALGGAEGIRQ
jgi:5-methyltetrahydropteroyltriglutamate--homocysteine methyltransferase